MLIDIAPGMLWSNTSTSLDLASMNTEGDRTLKKLIRYTLVTPLAFGPSDFDLLYWYKILIHINGEETRSALSIFHSII